MLPLSHESIERMAEPARNAVATGDIPGVVCLVWQRGELLQIEAVGLRNIEARLPVERDTIFRIASMSKPVTTAVALRLVEQGAMRLEDPITKWAPEFSEMRVLRQPGGSLDDTYPAPRPITIEDLMTHRSGLSYGFTAKGPLAVVLQDKFGFKTDRWNSPDEWMGALASLPLSFAPGERFNYSHSTDVLGFIVGRAARSSLREAMQELLFTPLQMPDTDFWIPPEKRARAAVLYATPARGNFTPASLPGFLDEVPPVITAGGHGLVSTADDYLAFGRMLLQGGELNGKRILSQESVGLMTTNRLTPAQRRDSQFGMPFFMAQGFGLGLSVITDPKKNAWLGTGSRGSFGWPGLFGGWWQVDPQQQMVMLWLQQTMPPQSPAGSGSGSRVAEMLARWIFSSPALVSLMTKMAQRSGKGPRLPGIAATQNFQRETYSALDAAG
ncbi:MAG TPA: serine hydrolase domain-containing protein [Steroidobacteraceae bacterium]|jgi:CubicO group peptidase (beta-lactamase class C family)